MVTGDSATGWLSGSAGMSGSAAMAARHVYARPEFVCQWCAQPWPCSWARAALLEQNPDLVYLSRRMGQVMHQAACDLEGRISAQQLWERFLGWIDVARQQQVWQLPAEPPAQPWWRQS
jgi:hypothetical protein